MGLRLEDVKATIAGNRTALQTALDAESLDKKAVLDLFDNSVSTQSNFGQQSYDKVSSSKKKFEGMFSDIGYNPEEGTLKDFVSNLSNSKVDNNQQIELLTDRADKLLKRAEAAEAKALEKEKSSLKKDLMTRLSKEFEDRKIDPKVRDEFIEAALARKDFTVLDDGEFGGIGESGAVTLDSAIENYFSRETVKAFVLDEQTPGSGATSSTGTSNKITSIEDVNRMSDDDWNDPAKRKQAYIIEGNERIAKTM